MSEPDRFRTEPPGRFGQMRHNSVPELCENTRNLVEPELNAPHFWTKLTYIAIVNLSKGGKGGRWMSFVLPGQPGLFVACDSRASNSISAGLNRRLPGRRRSRSRDNRSPQFRDSC